LEEAKALSIPALWLQPGAAGENTYSAKAEKITRKKNQGVYRDNGMSSKVILAPMRFGTRGSEILDAKAQNVNLYVLNPKGKSLIRLTATSGFGA